MCHIQVSCRLKIIFLLLEPVCKHTYFVSFTVKQVIQVPVHVPQPFPVEKKVHYAVPVMFNRPYPVKVYVPKPYPVERRIPYPVKVPIAAPYPVEKKVNA